MLRAKRCATEAKAPRPEPETARTDPLEGPDDLDPVQSRNVANGVSTDQHRRRLRHQALLAPRF